MLCCNTTCKRVSYVGNNFLDQLSGFQCHIYQEFFWAYQYMYQDQDFEESIGEYTVRQTD